MCVCEGSEIGRGDRLKAYLSPEEASLQIGICPREIRKLMRLGKIDLGLAIPPSGGKKHWTFRIYQRKINKIIGKESEDEVEGV